MNIDFLVVEIGSTITKVNAFTDGAQFCLVGQGKAPTTVSEGDVTIGLENAITDLKKNLGTKKLIWKKILANSSAAGGLKMTVHGLVYDMTVKAAKEAALGAGANIHLITAGKIKDTDLRKIKKIKPGIILLTGGVDYGDEKVVVYNANCLKKIDKKIPIIYAGNVVCQEKVREILKGRKLEIVDNVYPKIDELNVVPTRKIIQKVFEEHIISAPGMSKIKKMVTDPILPTPGAVMNMALLLAEKIGDLMVIDIGGATTDVHSVTEGSETINKILITPEPYSKRTVEGDLGVFVNASNVLRLIDEKQVDTKLKNCLPIPKDIKGKELVVQLARKAMHLAVERHTGAIKHIFGPFGRKTVAEGKDLTNIKWIIGTGGVLTRLKDGGKLLAEIKCRSDKHRLYPDENAKILIDNHYIMSSMGCLAALCPEKTVNFLKKNLKKCS